jgi:hypothetical protein
MIGRCRGDVLEGGTLVRVLWWNLRNRGRSCLGNLKVMNKKSMFSL